jgi:hypothetical protein
MKSYEQALKHYNSRPVPPRSKKWKAMPDNARPLKRTGDTQKGIHMCEDGTIYYRLYDTNIMTLHPRHPDGSALIEMRYCNSPTTNKFMSDFGLWYGSLLTTEDKHVRVPDVQTRYDGIGKGYGLSATLVFDKDDRLIVNESWHAPIYTYGISQDDKLQRKHIVKQLDTLFTLTMFRLADFKANAEITNDLGAPFSNGSGNYYNPSPTEVLKDYIAQQRYSTDILHEGEFIKLAMDAGQHIFDVLASKRCYAAGCITASWERIKYPERAASLDGKRNEIIEAVTPEDYVKSFKSAILRMFNLTGSARKDWGQFRESLPTKWYA